LPCPIVVQSNQARASLEVFAALVPEIVARFGTVDEIDLRIAGRIVVRPGSVDDSTDLSKGKLNAET
jgi:hypothetical protein